MSRSVSAKTRWMRSLPRMMRSSCPLPPGALVGRQEESDPGRVDELQTPEIDPDDAVAVRLCVRQTCSTSSKALRSNSPERRITTSPGRCSVSTSKSAMVTSGMGWADGPLIPCQAKIALLLRTKL